jgi:hypothetical protein
MVITVVRRANSSTIIAANKSECNRLLGRTCGALQRFRTPNWNVHAGLNVPRSQKQHECDASRCIFVSVTIPVRASLRMSGTDTKPVGALPYVATYSPSAIRSQVPQRVHEENLGELNNSIFEFF